MADARRRADRLFQPAPPFGIVRKIGRQRSDRYQAIPLGLSVATTTPAAGSVISTQPTTFTVNVTDPVDPATLDAGDWTVNGTPATSVSYTPGGTTITFTYAGTPHPQHDADEFLR